MDIKIEIPEYVKKILDTLHHRGYEAYIVGGCVRDKLIGRLPSDYDVTTNAKPEEIIKLFSRTVPTGIEHGTVTVLAGNKSCEVTTYRIDGKYEDSRHPKEVSFTASLEEDLRRRDFTVNAFAYSEETGLIDLFDGIDDLKNKTIRCVGDPKERFLEDALRIMRAFRFSAELGFKIEKNTLNAAGSLGFNLKKISAERIRTELMRLICSDNPGCILDMYKAGITSYFLPEFDLMMKTEQNNPYHIYDVGTHTVNAMCNIRSDATLRLTMLLHDVAKPDTKTTDKNGTDHFYNHPAEGSKKAKEILVRLKFDNATIKDVTGLILYHDFHVNKCSKAEEVRKVMYRLGKEKFPLLIEVINADNKAKSPEAIRKSGADGDKLSELYESIIKNGEATSKAELAIGGKDLIAAGIKEGKEIGNILEGAMEDVLSNPEHNNREYLLDKDNIKRFKNYQKDKT